MLKNLLKFSIAVILIEVLMFFSLRGFLYKGSNTAVNDPSTPSNIGTRLIDLLPNEYNAGIKELLSSISLISQSRGSRSKAKNETQNSEATGADTPGNIIISKGLIKEPKLILVPLWINENKYFKIADDPIYIKVSNICSGDTPNASIEVKYSDGKIQTFDKVIKEEKKFICGNKYYVELLGFKAGGGSNDWKNFGNSAKIVLYECN